MGVTIEREDEVQKPDRAPVPTEAELRGRPACEKCGRELEVLPPDERHTAPRAGCSHCDDPKDPVCRHCLMRESTHDVKALIRCLIASNGLEDPFA